MKIFHSSCHGIPLSLIYFFVKKYYPKFFTYISEFLWVSTLQQIAKSTILSCFSFVFSSLKIWYNVFLISFSLSLSYLMFLDQSSIIKPKLFFLVFHFILSNLICDDRVIWNTWTSLECGQPTRHLILKENCISSIYQLSITQPIIPYKNFLTCSGTDLIHAVSVSLNSYAHLPCYVQKDNCFVVIIHCLLLVDVAMYD